MNKHRQQMNKKKTSSKERLIQVRTIITKALSQGACGFNDMFERALPDLTELYASTGEEALRLRSYEILQGMLIPGLADRKGKTYSLPKKLLVVYSTHKIFLTRSGESDTHAVLALKTQTSDVHEALMAFKLGVQDWLQNTDEGREAWTASGEDFNVGDLGSYNLKALQPFWKEHGVKSVRLGVNEDTRNPGCWTYDTVLG